MVTTGAADDEMPSVTPNSYKSPFTQGCEKIKDKSWANSLFLSLVKNYNCFYFICILQLRDDNTYRNGVMNVQLWELLIEIHGLKSSELRKMLIQIFYVVYEHCCRCGRPMLTLYLLDRFFFIFSQKLYFRPEYVHENLF